MTIKKRESVFNNYMKERNEQLLNNGGKYRLYTSDLPQPIGVLYETYKNEKKRPLYENYNGLIDYTYNNKDKYSKTLNEQYGRDVEKLGMYVTPNIKPSFRVNNYDGLIDYRKYVSDVYGKEESYAGHLAGLIGIRENAENLVYDIFPDMEGKTFADYINEILQYTDVKYAMEKDRVGIVKDINVANAVKGIITTNINNYSGRDTRLGMFTNHLYSMSLLNAANFNSMRRTKYITEGLETLYGNNLSNVYNLSSLFTIDENTGRIADPDSGAYTQTYIDKPIQEYLKEKNENFEIIDGLWNRDYSKISGYTGVYYNEGETLWGVSGVRTTTGFEYHDEGDDKNGNAYKNDNVSTLKDINISNMPPEKREYNNGDNILTSTNALFYNRKVKTMIGRYYVGDEDDKTPSLTQSAVSSRFGLSHGRNLLTKNGWQRGDTISKGGYKNPYCRVWTYHNQYSKMSDLIRPFNEQGIGDLQKNWNIFRGYEGEHRLDKHSVLNKNGMVNITPTKDGDVDIKSCMFSIENLAWKDILLGNNSAKYKLSNGEFINDYQSVLSEEQRGPNGGRIMWFPPYDIEFQENVNVKWDSSEFIGRGEPVYTYVNTKRSGTLSFTMLVDNPAILNYWMLNKKNNATEDDEQTLLRYFAGCETIDPDKNVIEAILNGAYEGGSVNISGATPEQDVVFYTFFPNDYSGKDEKGEFINRLFKGANKDDLPLEVGDEKVMLGYEMTTNPISFEVESRKNVSNIEWSLDEVLSYHQISGVYEYDKFKNGAQINLNDFKNGNYDNFILYNLNKYNRSNNEYQNDDLTLRLGEIEKSIKSIIGDGGKLPQKENDGGYSLTGGDIKQGSKLYGLKEKINKLGSNTGNTLYLDLKGQYDGYAKQVSSLMEEENSIKTKQGDIRDINDNIDGENSNIEEFFTGKTQFLKTNAIYFHEDNGELSTESTLQRNYAQYLVKNDQIPSYDSLGKFIENRPEFGFCRLKNKDGFYELEIQSINSLSDSDFKLTTKKKFNKDSLTLGKVKDEKNNKTTYLVKTSNGEVLEFETYGEVSEAIKEYRLMVSYATKDDFKESNDAICLIGNKIYRKQEKLCDSNSVVNKIVELLPTDITEMIEKYYLKNIFITYEEVKDMGVGYGMVQYFYTKSHSGNAGYKNLQDFVIRSGLKMDFNNTDDIVTISGCTSDNNGVYLYNAKLDNSQEKTYKYPVDSDKEKTIYKKQKSYIDLKSFGLNSTFEIVKKYVGDESITCSFGEFYAGIKDNVSIVKQFVLDCERAVLIASGCTGETLEKYLLEAEGRIDYISLLFGTKSVDNELNIWVNKCSVLGDASSDGQKSKNEELAKSRALSMQDFLNTISLLKDKVKLDDKHIKDKKEGKLNEPIEDMNISDIQSKVGRRVKTTIVIGENDEIRKSINNKESSGITLNNEEIAAEMQRYRRYDNERLFFEMLKENDNIAYSKLVDKVKYFTPAFHSTTPEGFNARLTFLHQCTRQGPTMTASDIGKKETTAANLAFGRAPFCILRLGDFLNTKIVINSVNISYPDNQWDINPESIGMQYMMAKVQMNIDIIGGSDISAPIKRLQNAVSFNYYANTSLYDNRSDVSQYNGKGGIDVVRQWNPEIRVPETVVKK